MIELPEAFTIAKQMDKELKGSVVKSCMRGNTPHKFAFYNHTPSEYEQMLVGKTIGGSKSHGSFILSSVGMNHFLVLGEGGERITFHESEKTIPKKHQLLLGFEDGKYLSVTVQGWGMASIFDEVELKKHKYFGKKGISPISADFTLKQFLALFDGLKADDSRSVKYFIISDPGILGVANGFLQDILFLAKLHPQTKAVKLVASEKETLYKAVRDTLTKAVTQGGRDTEYDLYDNPGGYKKILDSRSVGKPCPVCETAIEKKAFLGGTCYFCPFCQPLS